MVAPALLARGDWAAIADAFGAAVARVAAPGVLVQVREKDLDGGPLLALASAAIATGARVAVNDRVDVALAAGAHGVHLPERGLAIATAREIAGSCAISVGASRHSLDGVRAAASADLVQLGPIWETPGKGPALGLDALRAARAALDDCGSSARLVAIGGITDPARAQLALAAGAHAVAAIRAAWAADFCTRDWLGL